LVIVWVSIIRVASNAVAAMVSQTAHRHRALTGCPVGNSRRISAIPPRTNTGTGSATVSASAAAGNEPGAMPIA
jgi:hypothetical protein